jgi:hypothetical protein
MALVFVGIDPETGDGTFLEHELSDDPEVVSTCAEAFAP